MDTLLDRLHRVVSCLRSRAARDAAEQRRSSPAQASLGVLFVHGMGTHPAGTTLRDFGDPIVDLLARRGIGVTNVHLTETGAGSGKDPAYARCEFTVKKQPRTWLLAESCWSDAFQPVAYPRIAFWLVAAVPWSIGEYLRGAWKRENDAANFRAIRWVRKLLIALYGALATLLTGPLVIVLALLPLTRLIPIGTVRDLFERVPRALAASLGDVYVILTTDGDRGRIYERVLNNHDWLAARCDHTVVVAHSAGAALTHKLIADDRMKGVTTYITLGEAIWRMRWMSALSRDAARRVSAIVLAILGTLAIAAVIPTVAVGPPWLWIGVLAGAVALHAASAFVVWSLALPSTRATVRRELANKVPRWRDYVASSDPIAAGSLTETAHDTTPTGRDKPADGDTYQPVGVHNKRSIFLDHTSYPDNLEEFVAGLMREFADADATAGLRITPWTLEAGKGSRRQNAVAGAAAPLQRVRRGGRVARAAPQAGLVRHHWPRHTPGTCGPRRHP